ncbi:MAG TPA: hypothetical protein VM889_05060 [Candidatus Thermoplasmatota archaeon]|nr:hypothetical protein [Candidatus Thermoplasmatota archaeon]
MTEKTIMGKTVVRAWLTALGAVLILLGVLGLVPQFTGEPHTIPIHLEEGEMVLHWVLGIVTLGIAFGIRDEAMARNLANILGVAFVVVGLGGFVAPDIGVWHVGVVDNVLHIVVGAVTLAVAMMNRDAMTQPRGGQAV